MSRFREAVIANPLCSQVLSFVAVKGLQNRSRPKMTLLQPPYNLGSDDLVSAPW